MKKRNLVLSVLCASSIALLSGCKNDINTFNPNGNVVVLLTSNIKGSVYNLKKIKGLKEDLEEKGAEVYLIDSGNFLSSSKYSNYDSGKTFISLMKDVGYSAVNLGAYDFCYGSGKIGTENHEVFYEDGTLGSNLKEVNLDAISNIKTSEDVYAFNSSKTITTKNGLKIGVVGVIDSNASSYILESNISDLKTNVEASETQNVLLGLDVDIKITLENYTYDNSSFSTYSDIDYKSLTDGSFKIEAYSYNDGNLNKKVFTSEIDNYTSNALDEKINNLEESISGDNDTKTIFTSDVILNGSTNDNRTKETNLGDFWADALRWYALNGDLINNGEVIKLSVSEDKVVSIWNGGNLRDYIYQGEVSMKDLKRVLPYPNKLGVMYLKGNKLLELLEVASSNLGNSSSSIDSLASFMQVSGIKYEIDTTKEYSKGDSYGKYWYKDNNVGSRVKITSINGNAFDENETYGVITSNAVLNGMDSNYVATEDGVTKVIFEKVIRDIIPTYVQDALDGKVGEKYKNTDGRIIVK